MIDWMFICVLIIAMMLFLLIIIFEDEIQTQWIMGLVIFDIAIWWSLAAGQLELEIPYEMYNATSGNIETGSHIFSSKTSPALTYLFSAPAVIMLIYFIFMLVTIIRGFVKKSL